MNWESFKKLDPNFGNDPMDEIYFQRITGWFREYIGKIYCGAGICAVAIYVAMHCGPVA